MDVQVKKTAEIYVWNDVCKIKCLKEDFGDKVLSNEKIPFNISKAITEELAYEIPEGQWANSFKTGRWSGKLYLFNYKDQEFPTGCFTRVGRVLKKYGYKLAIIDKRVKPTPDKEWVLTDKVIDDNGEEKDFSLRDYQVQVRDICLETGRGCVSAATGSGKTTMFISLIASLSCSPTIVFVPTVDLLYQTQASIEKLMRENGQPIKVGLIGDGKADLQDITVCIVDSALAAYGLKYDASKKKVIKDASEPKVTKTKSKKSAVQENKAEIVKLIESAKVIIVDESHLAASDKWRATLSRCKSAYYRFAFSATQYRSDGRDMEIEAAFGKLLVDIPLKQMIDMGVLKDPQIYMKRIYYDPEGAELTKIYEEYDPDTKKTVEVERTQWVPVDDWNYQDFYKNVVVYNEELNQAIASYAQTFNSKNMSVLILVKELEHGKILEELIPGSLFLSGKDSSKKRKEAIQNIKDKNLLTLIATSIADQGLDIPTLDVLILGGGGGSDPTRKSNFVPKMILKAQNIIEYKPKGALTLSDFGLALDEEALKFGGRIEQRIGRVVRDGSDYAIIIDFWFECKALKQQSSARRKIFKNLGLNPKIVN
jgi:superfamily II DNA or RNA helicase